MVVHTSSTAAEARADTAPQHSLPVRNEGEAVPGRASRVREWGRGNGEVAPWPDGPQEAECLQQDEKEHHETHQREVTLWKPGGRAR